LGELLNSEDMEQGADVASAEAVSASEFDWHVILTFGTVMLSCTIHHAAISPVDLS